MSSTVSGCMMVTVTYLHFAEHLSAHRTANVFIHQREHRIVRNYNKVEGTPTGGHSTAWVERAAPSMGRGISRLSTRGRILLSAGLRSFRCVLFLLLLV